MKHTTPPIRIELQYESKVTFCSVFLWVFTGRVPDKLMGNVEIDIPIPLLSKEGQARSAGVVCSKSRGAAPYR
jgi:hypothetical protein